MKICILKGEQDEPEGFPVLNFRNIEDNLNKRSIDPELARIIVVIEKTSQKKGVILVDTILDLVIELSKKKKKVDTSAYDSSTIETNN